MTELDPNVPLHASAFSYKGAGCLVLGASGTGKSRLVAEAVLMGAKLVADDRLMLEPMMGMLAAVAIPELAGVLELRGLGIVKMNDFATKQMLHLIIELDPSADTRLPEPEKRTFHGIEVPYLKMAPLPQTSVASVLLYVLAMQEGRVLPTDWRPNVA